MDSSFSENYPEARSKFIEAVKDAGGAASRYLLDRRGPDGGELSTDVAWFGPRDAKRVFVTISGTHGVEGFYGSATQIEWLRRGEVGRLPPGSASLLIHAINPFGFAWLRRTNEDNIDINRNWVDFGRPSSRSSRWPPLSALMPGCMRTVIPSLPPQRRSRRRSGARSTPMTRCGKGWR
jgi:Protein of unknown function (DUF2817)